MIKDQLGRCLISNSDWYFPNVVDNLLAKGKGEQQFYIYYRGKKITSDMTEEEMYKEVYGSKEAYFKKYPEYSEESLATSKKELLYSFLAVAPAEVVKNIEAKTSVSELSIDADLGEYVLALANGATCEEVFYLMKSQGYSGAVFSWELNAIASSSLRGQEFLEFYKSIDPEGYNFYFESNEKSSMKM